MALWKALKYLFPTADPTRDYEIHDIGAGPFIAVWHLQQSQPTPAQLQQASDAYDAREAQQQQDAAALRQQLLTAAQSAVGVQVNQLTAGQIRAIVALLLRKEGGLNPDTTVKPLADWVR